MIGAERIISLQNVKVHPPLGAGASVETGVEPWCRENILRQGGS